MLLADREELREKIKRTRWVHIDDALPEIDEWVPVGGFSNKKIEDENGIRYEREEWTTHGYRQSLPGGGWCWCLADEDDEANGLEYWAYENNLPEPRHFKLRGPRPKTPPPEVTP